MKKTLLLGLVLILAAGAVFADDAKAMPKMVGRLWIAPTFGFAPAGYGTDGKYDPYGSGEGFLKMLNLGFALEYGIIDWITGAIQWAPGVNVWSDVDKNLSVLGGSGNTVNVNGVADLFAGAKVQIVGEKAPVKTDRIRFALGPGVKIPLPGQDFEDQFKNTREGKTVTASNLDYHVFGAGVRVYFDYIFNEHFFINLYNETIFYPVEGDIDKASLTEYGTFYGVKNAAAFGGAGNNADAKVNYGYDLTFELEPVYSTSLGDSGVTLTAGLPVNYKFTPGRTYSVSGGLNATVNENIKANLKSRLTEDEPTHMFKVKPNISFFFTKWILPTDIGITYGLPVWGKNNLARHEITLKVKLYFALPGAGN
ncbi:MAG: hypothetical protein LBP29_00570 [Treponema sp.]|nr:hypothetical protein [Treponema sp.]